MPSPRKMKISHVKAHFTANAPRSFARWYVMLLFKAVLAHIEREPDDEYLKRSAEKGPKNDLLFSWQIELSIFTTTMIGDLSGSWVYLGDV